MMGVTVCHVIPLTSQVCWFALGLAQSDTHSGKCLCSRAGRRSLALGMVPVVVLPHPSSVLLTQLSALGDIKETLQERQELP